MVINTPLLSRIVGVPRLLLTLLPLATLALAPPSSGQGLPGFPAPAETEEATPEPPPRRVLAERASPRATMTTFLESVNERDWPRAVDTLHMRRDGFTGDVILARGMDMAAELKAVIDRVAFVDLDEIPRDLGTRGTYVWRTVDGIPITLARAEGEWLFSRETLDALPDLWEAVKEREVVEGVEETPETPSRWLRGQMPKSLRGGGFILEYWQWLALAVLIL